MSSNINVQALTYAKAKLVKSLAQSKFRKKHQSFFVEGRKMVLEAILNKNVSKQFIVVKEGINLNFLSDFNIPIYQTTSQEFKKLSGQVNPDGILIVLDLLDFENQAIQGSNLLYIDVVSDPGNLGNIIRTANFLGFNEILLPSNSVDPFNPKVCQASMGSIFDIKLHLINDPIQTLKDLKSKNYILKGFDLNGKNLKEFINHPKQVLIFGNESHGLSNEVLNLLDQKYTILNRGTAESLNLGNSIAIGLYQSTL
jgi:TrmH family RNA methyltransferase